MDRLGIFLEFIVQHKELAEFVLICIFALCTLLYIYYFNPDFFQKIKDGLKSFFTTWQFAQEHKAIWFFALLKIIVIFVVFALFYILKEYNIITIDIFSESSSTSPGTTTQSIAISFKELLFVIITFMGVGYLLNLIDVAAVTYILNILNKQKTTIISSFYKSFSRAWAILKFFLLDYVIRIITRNRKAESSRFSLVNAVLKSIMGLAWSMATFFIMPVIAEEKLTLKQSISKSAEIMKNHFGNVVGFQFGMGFLMAPVIVMLLFIALLCGIGALLNRVMQIPTEQVFTLLKIPLIVSSLVMLAFLTLAITAGMVITWIFTCAAYNYAQGKDTGPFDEHFIDKAMVKK